MQLLLIFLAAAALGQQPAPRTSHHRPATHAAPAPKEQAYYCASGNVVKYHSSATCRGLNRCSARVEPLALSDAQSRMEPCKLCH